MDYRRSRHVLIVALALLILLASTALAQPLPVTWRFPQPEGSTLLRSVAYGNGQYLAVGEWGAVARSTDGLQWVQMPREANLSFISVRFFKGVFIAEAHGGLMVSPDGTAWRKVLDGGDTGARVNYAGGRLIAGTSAGVYTSDDGINWTKVSSTYVSSILYGNGRYFSIDRRTELPISSEDGAVWTATGGPKLRGEAYGGGQFVGLSWEHKHAMLNGEPQFTFQVYVSTDGLKWTETATALPLSAASYVRGRFVFISQREPGPNKPWRIYTSADGRTWDESAAPPGLQGISGEAGDYIFGWGPGGLMRSRDGLTWTPLFDGPQPVERMIVAQNRWYAVGAKVYASADGITWAEAAHQDRRVYVNGRWFRLAADPGKCGLSQLPDCESTLYVSLNGVNWAAHPFPGKGLDEVVYGNGRYLIGQYVTRDFVTWSRADMPKYVSDLVDERGRTFGGGLFAYVESHLDVKGKFQASVYTSPDGESWTQRPLPAPEYWVQQIAYGNGLFVVGSQNSTVFTSPDGQTWTKRPIGTTATIRKLAFVDGRFVASSYGPTGDAVLVSRDGITWDATPTPFAVTVAGVNGRLIAGGDAILELGAPADDGTCGRAFSDLSPWHPACRAVENLAGRKIVGGFPDGHFRPEQGITRAEFAKMLTLASGRTPAPGAAVPFADAEGHWAASQGYLQAVLATGAMAGFPDQTIRPDSPLTRAQLVKLVAAVAGVSPAGQPSYDDVAADAWFSGWVAAAADKQLIGPAAAAPLWTDPTFLGNEPASRAEAAMLLNNWLATRGN